MRGPRSEHPQRACGHLGLYDLARRALAVAAVIWGAALSSGCDLASEAEDIDVGVGFERDTSSSDFSTCDVAALAAQCPPGSTPLLGEAAASRCRLASESVGGYESGFDAGVCQGQGSCVVACNFDNPCECGVERVTNEGVFCIDCREAATCGNAICEGGETPENCPIDCAPRCETDAQRCNGATVEVCMGGSWRPDACRPGESCFLNEAQRRAYCTPAPSPFEEGLPTLAAPRVQDVDPRRLYDPIGTLRCPGTLCRYVAFALDGTSIYADSFIGRGSNQRSDRVRIHLPDLTYDVIDEFPTLSVGLGGTTCEGRQPTTYRDQETRRTVSLEPIVDDTIPLACRRVAWRPDLDRVYAIVVLDGRFLLLATWDLSTGDVRRLLRYVNPEHVIDYGGTMSLHVSEDGELALLSYEHGFVSGGGGRGASTVVWKPNQGAYAGVVDAFAVALRPGFATMLSRDKRVINLEDVTQWERSEDELLGFTPDGAYVFGLSRDPVSELTLVTLYDAREGRLMTRIPTHSVAGSTASRPRTVVFSPNGQWLLLGDLVYGMVAPRAE